MEVDKTGSDAPAASAAAIAAPSDAQGESDIAVPGVSAGVGGPAQEGNKEPRFEIKKYAAVALWSWGKFRSY